MRFAFLTSVLAVIALATSPAVAQEDVTDQGTTDETTAPDPDSEGNDDGATDTASEDNETPELDDLRPPSTAAFTLLGISPTEIEQPRTPKELATVLGAAIGETAPDSLAVAFAPYWLVRHDALDASEYEKEWYLHWLRTASISVGATSEEVADDPMAAKTSLLAVGVHTLLYKGKPAFTCEQRDNLFITTSDQAKAQEERINAFIASPELATKVQKYERELLTRMDQAAAAEAAAKYRETLIVTFVQEDGLKVATEAYEENSEVFEAREAELKVCAQAQLVPRGFSLAAAGGAVFDFVESKWKNGRDRTYAAWLSPAWQGDAWAIAGLGRFTSDQSEIESEALWDVGGRATYVGQSFHLSIEHVSRFGNTDDDPDSDYSWRLAATLEQKYKDTWLVLSIGKDYDSASGDDFFALANLQFDIGEPQITSTELAKLKKDYECAVDKTAPNCEDPADEGSTEGGDASSPASE